MRDDQRFHANVFHRIHTLTADFDTNEAKQQKEKHFESEFLFTNGSDQFLWHIGGQLLRHTTQVSNLHGDQRDKMRVEGDVNDRCEDDPRQRRCLDDECGNTDRHGKKHKSGYNRTEVFAEQQRWSRHGDTSREQEHREELHYLVRHCRLKDDIVVDKITRLKRYLLQAVAATAPCIRTRWSHKCTKTRCNRCKTIYKPARWRVARGISNQ